MATLFVDKLDPQSGTSLEIGSSGDTITIPSGATITNNGTQTGFGGTNTPAFMAKPDGNITIGDDTVAKMTFDTEVFDTDGCYSSSRFTPDVAGKYMVSGAAIWNTNTSYDGLSMGRIFVYKNGSEIYRNHFDPRNSSQDIISSFNYISVAVEMNGTSDYVELYGYVDVLNSGISDFWQTGSYFSAYRLIT